MAQRESWPKISGLGVRREDICSSPMSYSSPSEEVVILSFTPQRLLVGGEIVLASLCSQYH